MADLLIAWALLRAAHKWGEASYAEAPRGIARDVLRACTHGFRGPPHPAAGRARIPARQHTIVVNPSYFAIGAFRALSRHVPDASWAALEAASLDILRASALGRWRLPPDWCEISRDATIRPAPDWPPRFSWDAVRIPVHLRLGRPLPSPRWRRPRASSSTRATPIAARLDRPLPGQISPYPGHAGILAVAQFAAMRTGVTAPMRRIAISESPDYYGASLVLMTGMASVEPPEAPAEVRRAAAPAPAGGGRMAAVMRISACATTRRRSPLSAPRSARKPTGRAVAGAILGGR